MMLLGRHEMRKKLFSISHIRIYLMDYYINLNVPNEALSVKINIQLNIFNIFSSIFNFSKKLNKVAFN